MLKNTTRKHGRGGWGFGFWVLFVLCGLSVWIFRPQAAMADPHAVFYTAIGQQQIFFNFLAALDQADYVEPSDYGAFNRELQVKARAGAPTTPQYGEETQTEVVATESELSAILVRPITLDGKDATTLEEVKQLSLESAKRNALSDLVGFLCENTEGIKDCQGAGGGGAGGLMAGGQSGNVAGISDIILNSIGQAARANTHGEGVPGNVQENQAEAAVRRERAMVDYVAKWKSWNYKQGAAAVLESGTQKDLEIREGRANTSGGDIEGISKLPGGIYAPRAYSETLDSWRTAVTGTPLKNYYENYITFSNLRTLNPADADYVSGHPFGRHFIDPNDKKAKFVAEVGQPEGWWKMDAFSDSADLTRRLVLGPVAALELAIKGTDRVMVQQELCEKDGRKCDFSVIASDADPLGVGHREYGELTMNIFNPEGNRSYQYESALDSIHESDSDQVFAPADGQTLEEGEERLVEDESGAELSSPSEAGEVKGISDGQVAGTNFSPRVNLIDPHDEGKMGAFLKLTLPGTYTDYDCGNSCYD